jgi:hypothetical protein
MGRWDDCISNVGGPGRSAVMTVPCYADAAMNVGDGEESVYDGGVFR